MIIKRLSKGIKEQDWVTAFVEIAVVIIGVYIGIFVGQAQEDRDTQEKVSQSLQVLLEQMKEDLIQLDAVITAQEDNQAKYQHVLDLLEVEIINNDRLGKGLNDALAANRTFFPNESAYQSMRELGYLAQLKDKNLALGITVYFDSALERHSINANTIDDVQGWLQRNVRDMLWDRRKGEFLGEPDYAVARLWNGFRNTQGTSTYYLTILMEVVRPRLVKTISEIEVYLKGGADNDY